MAALQEREQRREYERGKREAAIDSRLGEHDQSLLRLNRSLEELGGSLTSLESQMGKLEKAYTTSTAVAAAIAEKAVSTRTFLFGVLALLVPIVVLVVTLLAGKTGP